MSDLIRKADALPIFCMRCVRVIDCANDMTGNFKNNCPIKKEVDDLPSAEPETVRCKDCKYWERQTYQGTPLSWGRCESELMWDSIQGEELEHIETNEEHFCGYAERRKYE